MSIPAGEVELAGDLCLAGRGRGLVIFAHGSGSSRLSHRNRAVASSLRQAGLSTLLFDLLTSTEEPEDSFTGHIRFNIPFLARRLIAATDWIRGQPDFRNIRIGYFGASTGAAAALVAAADKPEGIAAVVSRGGRPDLAAGALPRVKAPTCSLSAGMTGWCWISTGRRWSS